MATAKQKAMKVLTLTGKTINEALSFLVFSLLDLLDFLLCFLFKAVDFAAEAEWRPCYCTSPKAAITGAGAGILLSEKGEAAKVVCLSASKLRLEDVSGTLYSRPSAVSEASRAAAGWLARRLRIDAAAELSVSAATSFGGRIRNGTVRSAYRVNSAIVEMLQGKMGGQKNAIGPKWSDCDCDTCTSWISSPAKTLFVRVDGAKGGTKGTEDVLFIHGYISSSRFWTETVFPSLSSSAKSKYRLFAVDLLGFGRSPKPSDSLYTLREHVEMIEKSVIEPYKVKDLHIVAHSLGCILALALAVKHPGSIKSLTLLAPPYFGTPKQGGDAGQYVMGRIAPRHLWPPVAFGASIACWYEHISRAICLIFSKHHRIWELLIVQLTRHRIKQFLLEGFWCHTHNAIWHTLHNIICGTHKKLEQYLDTIRDGLTCDVTIFHGQDDELIPVECSYNVKSKIPRARVQVIEKKDHLTIVTGRENTFARELEEIWRRSSSLK